MTKLKTWTDDKVEELKTLWDTNLSASQIARELGGVTSNAVIGKAHRLGLAGRARTPSEAARQAPHVRKKRPKARLVKAATTAKGNLPSIPNIDIEIDIGPDFINIVPLTRRVSLLELTETTCRWPIGTPGEDDFCYCGKIPLKGLPYCAGHTRLAYQPIVERPRTAVRRY